MTEDRLERIKQAQTPEDTIEAYCWASNVHMMHSREVEAQIAFTAQRVCCQFCRHRPSDMSICMQLYCDTLDRMYTRIVGVLE